MEKEEIAMIIAGICVVLGTILSLVGIITSEIQIQRYEYEEIYGNANN